MCDTRAMAAPSNTQFAVAIHVLTLISSGHPEFRSSEAMAQSVGSSPVYIRRVLGHLREAGLVTSRPGPGGGWDLTRPATDITLGDAWRAIQEGAPVFGLHQVAPECPVGSGIAVTLTELDHQLTAVLEDHLDRTTIAEVIPANAGMPVETA